MKNLTLKFTLISLLSVVLNSCKEPLVTFEVAQPENVREQKEFPNKLIGNYYDAEGSTDLIIEKYFIIKRTTINDTLSISELSENERIVKDTFYDKNSNQKSKIRVVNDTLFTDLIILDTVFNIIKGDVLKKHKGYYFLNTKWEKTWTVEKLSLAKGILQINSINTKEEITILETITNIKRDSAATFKVKPTKKQFQEFVKRNGFSEGEIYLKR